MNIHIVNRDKPDKILARKARVLADATGWTLGRKPDPDADMNYFFPYLNVKNYAGPKAAYFTHRDDPMPGKVATWYRQAQNVDLRITSAVQYEKDLQPFGPTRRILPPLDREKFSIGKADNSSGKLVLGVSGFVASGGRKGESLVRELLKKPVASEFDWKAAGKGWPVKTTFYNYEKLHEFYQSLDVYLCPSTVEGVPYGPLEALACGKAVVIPRGVGLLDDLPTVNGVFRYDAGDAASLADALAQATTKSWDSEELRSLTEPFTPENWAEGHIQAFEKPSLKTDRGVYIVAYGANARTCANRLINSIRAWLPDTPVLVCSETPLPGADLWLEGDSSLKGRVAKTNIYDWAPAEWEYVLYLDADTEIVNDPSRIWKPLESGYELMLHDNSPRSSVHYNRRPTNTLEYNDLISTIDPEWRGVAGGVFGFRRCETAKTLFSRWRAEYMKWRGTHDQLSLVKAFYSLENPDVYWLGSEWNRFTKYESSNDYTIIRHWGGGPARPTGDGVGVKPPYERYALKRKLSRGRYESQGFFEAEPYEVVRSFSLYTKAYTSGDRFDALSYDPDKVVALIQAGRIARVRASNLTDSVRVRATKSFVGVDGEMIVRGQSINLSEDIVGQYVLNGLVKRNSVENDREASAAGPASRGFPDHSQAC